VVRLRYGTHATELEVRDFGGGRGEMPAADGSGYGLVGMRERAELIGGTLEAGPSKEGFRVFLEVPTS
jgi:signal transduction histidine kinase